MTPPEHCHQVDQAINEEVNRRINTITTPPENTELDHQPVVEEQPQLVPVGSDSDSDKEVTPTIHLRRVPPRLSKRILATQVNAMENKATIHGHLVIKLSMCISKTMNLSPLLISTPLSQDHPPLHAPWILPVMSHSMI